MSEGASKRRNWAPWLIGGVVAVLALAAFVFRDDLAQAALDPKIPFQTYDPPPAPDYGSAQSWALLPGAAPNRPVDVFFIGPTTYDGGRHWNAPLIDKKADAQFRETMAPNYVGPFVTVGQVFAPRYRQASLYSLLTLREDAREARRFAYGDIEAAFRAYVAKGDHRPFILVGVEQGGTLGLRLLEKVIAPDPDLRGRLVAAYLIETVVPADSPPLPPCVERRQAGCLASWASVSEGDFETGKQLLDRALVWNAAGDLENLSPRPALCFNPILGAVTEAAAPARLHLGAANATGLEWGARPAFMTRQVAARCEGGVLRLTKPKSSSLRRSGSWTDKRKAPGFNLFYADLEADALARVAAYAPR